MAGRNDLRTELAALLPRLRRFARVLAGTEADADDLVQASIERALRADGQWRFGERPDAWMFKIMKNTWTDEMRARASRSKFLVPEEAGAGAFADGAGAMATHLEARAVQALVAALPDDQRAAIALVWVEGLSYREAAGVLDIPIGTLTSRLARGRAAIEAALTEKAS